MLTFNISEILTPLIPYHSPGRIHISLFLDTHIPFIWQDSHVLCLATHTIHLAGCTCPDTSHSTHLTCFTSVDTIMEARCLVCTHTAWWQINYWTTKSSSLSFAYTIGCVHWLGLHINRFMSEYTVIVC